MIRMPDLGGARSFEPVPDPNGAAAPRSDPGHSYAALEASGPRSRLAHVIRFGLLALLVLAPLPFGADRPIPWTLLALASGTLLVLWALQAARNPDPSWLAPSRLLPVVGAFGVVTLIAVLQTLPVAPRALVHPLWFDVASVLDIDVVPTISVDAYATTTSLMRFLTYGAVFWLALQVSRERGGARAILIALALAGLAYAAYGLFARFVAADYILWHEKWFRMRGLHSTFLNRNTYATYAGFGLIVCAGMAIWSFAKQQRATFRRSRIQLSAGSLFWLLGCGLLAAAEVLSVSRAGNAGTALGLLALLLLLHGVGAMPTRLIFLAAGAFLAIALGAVFVTGDQLIYRLGETDLTEESRFDVYTNLLTAIGDRPLLGVGFGTFTEAFHPYRGMVQHFIWDHAHNSYLQNAFELGLPATIALIGGLGWLALTCLKRLKVRREDALYPALALAVSVLAGIHALLDFSFEIPAIVITYLALLAIGVGRALSWRTQPGGGSRVERWSGPALAAVVAGLLLVLAVPRILSHLQALPLDVVEARGGAGFVDFETTERARTAGEAAAQFTNAGEVLAAVGRLELDRAAVGFGPSGEPLDAEAKVRANERAEDALERSLAVAPSHPERWAELAAARLGRGAPVEEVEEALDVALRIGPTSFDLIPYRAALAAQVFEDLSLGTRERFRDQFALAMQARARPFVEAIAGVGELDLVAGELERRPALQDSFERLARAIRIRDGLDGDKTGIPRESDRRDLAPKGLLREARLPVGP